MAQRHFGVESEIRTGRVVLTLHGDLDVESSQALLAAASEAIDRGDDHARLVIDLSDVPFADSSGLTALVRCCGLTPGRPPVLVGTSDALRGPMTTTGLDVLFEIEQSYEITAPHRLDLTPREPEPPR